MVAVAYPVSAGPRPRRSSGPLGAPPSGATRPGRDPSDRGASTGRPALRPVRPLARDLHRPHRRHVERRHAAEAVAILAAGAVWALGGVMGWLGSGPLAAPGPNPSRAVPVSASVYVVQPGDTLWSIARSLQPTGEIRPLVDRLAEQEHGRPLRAGDTLALP